MKTLFNQNMIYLYYLDKNIKLLISEKILSKEKNHRVKIKREVLILKFQKGVLVSEIYKSEVYKIWDVNNILE